MKNLFTILVFYPFLLFAQPPGMPNVKKLEADLRFLASDELKGRRTGSEGNLKAADFIANELKSLKYIAPIGADNYLKQKCL